MLENIRHVITSLTMDQLISKLSAHITSRYRQFYHIRLLWQQPLPSNGTLNILHLWTCAGRKREPISMKFAMQQQLTTAMTLMTSNIKMLQIQSRIRPACWKYWKCHNLPTNRPTGTQLGRTNPSMCPTCPHDAVAMAKAAAYQRRIKHSAVMGICSTNA